MKLRYYLRGLGIGILVTSVIFCVMPRNRVGMTDEEIRTKALEMGLVEESSLSLADVQEKLNEIAKNMEEQSQLQESMAKETEETPASETESQSTEETVVNGPLEGIDLVEYKTVVIPSGITSREVCELLEEAGIIEDADEFDDYLNMNGLSRSLRAGSYEFVIGASAEELVDKLLGK